MVRLTAAWSCFLALTAFVSAAAASTADYPGVIELVGYSNRRARTYFQETPRSNPNPQPGLTSAKTRADIETVKRNIRKYDRLLELDTKNLPEQQKDMLARIVERVARLKESLDIEEQQFNQQEATSSRSSSTSSTTPQETEAETERDQESIEQTTQPPSGSTEAETDPTLILDETTLLELQNTMNEQAAMSTIMKELPTTTDVSQQQEADSEATDEEGETTSPNLTTQSEASTTSDESLTESTDPDDQFVAARSNNNIAAITAADDPDGTTTTTANSGSQQRTLTTMGKLKNRATKRPFAHKVTAALKRGGQRPSAVSAAAANAAAASKPSGSTTSTASSTTQKQKIATNSFQQKQQQAKPLQKVTPSIGGGGSSNPSSSSIPSATTNSASPALPIEQLYTRTPQANIPLAAAAAAAAAASSSAAAPGSGGSAGSGATPATYSNQQDSMVYDAHVNASALIDSLNTNAREEYYQQKLGAANKDNKVNTSPPQ
uniref:Serine-rich adhesin for platelets n=1 Tax=Drosophila rhopaloa TaxID=1041015 RepID=A0A6P4ERJ8_DRORH